MNMLRAAVLAAFGILFLAPVAAGDLYSAKAAYEKNDYAAAFAEFRALAELGHPLAQESLAIMYASGQGVTRDGIRAYAWAKVARENGAGDRAQVIVDQLQQFVTPQTRQPVDEIHAAFGKQAIDARLFPSKRDGDTEPEARSNCKFVKAVPPARYYPAAALKNGISGSVIVEATIHPDGRARNPRVIFGMPPDTFSKAGRQAAFESEFLPSQESEPRGPCRITFTTNFYADNLQNDRAMKAQLEPIKAAAEAGDPSAQLHYAAVMMGWRQLNPDREEVWWMFRRAAQAGLPSAQYVVGVFAVNGSRSPENREKGLRWLEMAVAGGQSEAKVALARELLRGERGTEAFIRSRELLEGAADAGSKDGKYFLADLLVGDPDPARRDPRRALSLLREEYRLEDPGMVEIRAAAHSQIGDFDKAVSSAKSALSMARKFKWDVAPQTERLALYEKKQAWSGLLLTY
jgi:TonB family protein